MEFSQIKLKIYLKHKLPIIVILNNEDLIQKLINELNSLDYVIKFGDIIFLRDDFKFMTIKKEK